MIRVKKDFYPHSKIKLNQNDTFKLPYVLIFFCSLTTLFIIYIGYVRYNSEIHSNNAIKLKQKGNWNYVVKAIDKAYSKMFYEIDNTSTPLLWYRGVAYFSTKNYEQQDPRNYSYDDPVQSQLNELDNMLDDDSQWD